jgi:hypothetical protein
VIGASLVPGNLRARAPNEQQRQDDRRSSHF